MSNWGKSPGITYKRWRNTDISVVHLETDFVGRSDEDQCADYEICTTATQTADPSPQYEPDKTNGTFTVEEAVEAIGFGRFQTKLSILTGLSWMADAMEMMVLSILAPELHCEWRLSSLEVALITSAVFVGMAFGGSFWGNMLDKYGRKFGLTFCMVWTLYYGLLSAFAPVYGWILVLRGLVGFGIGGAPQSVTLYSEFLPMKRRATCIMLIEIFWAIGAVLEVLLAMWIMPTLGWHWLLGVSTLPMLLFVGLCFWLPESPRFDVLIGNRDNAMATLRRIANDNGTAMPKGVVTTQKQEARGRIQDLLATRYRRTTLLLWFIWFANAFSYYGLVLLTTELFQSGDVCGVNQHAMTEPSCSLQCKYLTLADYKDLLWTTLAEFPGIFIAFLVVDRLGRKKTMALCFVIFSLSLLPLFACIGRTALTVFIFIARGFITGGYQVAYVYTPEVFPTETRALGVGTCSGVGRIGALLTPFVAQVLLRKSAYAALSIYCGCCLLAAAASMCLPVETSGRGLQESSHFKEEQTMAPDGTRRPPQRPGGPGPTV